MFFAGAQQSMRELCLIVFMALSGGTGITGFRDNRLARIESYRILEVQRGFRPMVGTHRSRSQTSSESSAQYWLRESWDAMGGETIRLTGTREHLNARLFPRTRFRC
jgi:hypothetical protein